MNKVRCEKLKAVSAAITVSIQSNPNYSYNDALKVYKSAVAKSGTANQNINDRQVREQNQGRGGQGRFGRGFGRGYSSRRGRDGNGRGYSGRGDLGLGSSTSGMKPELNTIHLLTTLQKYSTSSLEKKRRC